MRLLENIYQFTGCMYGSHQNVYGIDTTEGVVLIDTGLNRADYEIIHRSLAYWGLAEKKITKVLLTHAHREHSGNAALFAQEGAQIYIHASEAEAIETGNDQVASYRFINEPEFSTVRECVRITDGDEITAGDCRFQVLHTPGHSAGSVIYALETGGGRILFTGDTVLADKLCIESRVGWTGGVDYDEEQYVNTLKRLATAEADADVVLSGHGEICMKDGGRLMNGAFLRARLLLTTQPHQRIVERREQTVR